MLETQESTGLIKFTRSESTITVDFITDSIKVSMRYEPGFHHRIYDFLDELRDGGRLNAPDYRDAKIAIRDVIKETNRSRIAPKRGFLGNVFFNLLNPFNW